jgi:5-methylcytosine-specific restriction endonuclease McrA
MMDTTNLPKTRAEAKELGAAYYFTGEPCKHGHIAPRKTKGSCVECLKVEWAKGNEARAEYFKAYNSSEAGQKAKKEYYERNKETVIARANARPLELRRAAKARHKTTNPEYYNTLNNVRKRRHRNATPPWITKEQKAAMRDLYVQAVRMTALMGDRYVVDHIVPLISPVVCGLHVPWNLRVITQEENLKKSNKLVDTTPTA